MSSSAQAVVDALADVATPRRVLIDHLDDLEQRRRRWIDRIHPEVECSEEDDDRLTFVYLDGATETFSAADQDSMPDLDEALRDFIDGGDPDWKTLPAEVRWFHLGSEIRTFDIVSNLKSQRAAIDKDLIEVAMRIEAAKQRLDSAFTSVRDRLRDWLDDLAASRATPADWGRIVKSWRASFTIPMRVGAHVLGVSSAAIARYETFSRTPSSRDVKAQVEALIEAGPSAGLDIARAVRGVSRLFGDRPVDLDTDPIPILCASIEDRLESLSTEQLQFIDALVADAQTLDQFRVWVTSAPIHCVPPAGAPGRSGAPFGTDWRVRFQGCAPPRSPTSRACPARPRCSRVRIAGVPPASWS